MPVRRWCAEVFARRLGSPLDSVLKLTDASGRQLAFNDDFEDKGAGLITHQADSRIPLHISRQGNLLSHLGDAQQKGGPESIATACASALRGQISSCA